jgi:hypothetical protein
MIAHLLPVETAALAMILSMQSSAAVRQDLLDQFVRLTLKTAFLVLVSMAHVLMV